MSRYVGLLCCSFFANTFVVQSYCAEVNGGADPNASIALTKFEVTEDSLVLEYEIVNHSKRDLWICTDVGVHRGGGAEVFTGYSDPLIRACTQSVDQDLTKRTFGPYNDETLYIRRVLKYYYYRTDVGGSHMVGCIFRFARVRPGETFSFSEVYELSDLTYFFNFPNFDLNRKMTLQNLVVEVEYLILPDDAERGIAEKREASSEFVIGTSMGELVYLEEGDKAKIKVGTGYDYEDVVRINPLAFEDTAKRRRLREIGWKKNRASEKILRLMVSGVKIPYQEPAGFYEDIEETGGGWYGECYRAGRKYYGRQDKDSD